MGEHDTDDRVPRCGPTIGSGIRPCARDCSKSVVAPRLVVRHGEATNIPEKLHSANEAATELGSKSNARNW